jgi:hypothetical protein
MPDFRKFVELRPPAQKVNLKGPSQRDYPTMPQEQNAMPKPHRLVEFQPPAQEVVTKSPTQRESRSATERIDKLPKPDGPALQSADRQSATDLEESRLPLGHQEGEGATLPKSATPDQRSFSSPVHLPDSIQQRRGKLFWMLPRASLDFRSDFEDLSGTTCDHETLSLNLFSGGRKPNANPTSQ